MSQVFEVNLIEEVVMIGKIQSKLANFKFISNKSEILLNLLVKEVFAGNSAEVEVLIQELTDLIDQEMIPLARSKLLKDSLIFLLKYYKNNRVKSLVQALIPKIDNPFLKLFVRIETLRVMAQLETNTPISGEIKSIDEDLRKCTPVIEQSSIASLQRTFLSIVSKFATESSDMTLLEFVLERLEHLDVELFRDETYKNVINNFYQMAISNDNPSLASRLFNLANKNIRDRSYWVETLFAYSKFLKKEGRSKEIETFIDDSISLLSSLEGEFTRAVYLKESIKLVENVEDNSARERLICALVDNNNRHQGLFSSSLVRFQLLETYISLQKLTEAKSLFQEIIKYANLINEIELYMVLFNHLLDAISKYPNIIDEEIVSFFVSKVKETTDPTLKSILLIRLAEKLENYPVHVTEIKNIVEQHNKPLVIDNFVVTSHIGEIMKFLIRQQGQPGNQEFSQNARTFIEGAPTQTEKCQLIIEFIDQFRKGHQEKPVNEFPDLLLEQIETIPNEFEKKDILVQFLNVL